MKLDVKSVLIGFFMCLCMVLFIASYGSSVGRFQLTHSKIYGSNMTLITDTTTGYTKVLSESESRPQIGMSFSEMKVLGDKIER